MIYFCLLLPVAKVTGCSPLRDRPKGGTQRDLPALERPRPSLCDPRIQVPLSSQLLALASGIIWFPGKKFLPIWGILPGLPSLPSSQ